MIKKLFPWERECIEHPERCTYEYFKEKNLDNLPPAAALGVADEELLNYFDNKFHKDKLFVLSMDPNGGNYQFLQDFVTEHSIKILGERSKQYQFTIDEKRIYEKFRQEFIFALQGYPEIQKIQLLKKLSKKCQLNPTSIDNISELFNVGSSLFALEWYSELQELGKFNEFNQFLYKSNQELLSIVERPCLLLPLWKHQKIAIERWLANGGKGILEMATATGKTLVALAAANHLFKVHKKMDVLVLAHSKAILNQWRREVIDKLGFIGSSSDSYSIPLIYQDSFKFHFDTFQTVYRYPTSYHPDFLIADEVHHGAGLEFRKALSIPCKFKMGLSATVEGKEKLEILYRYLGSKCYSYSLKEARIDGIIPEFSLYLHRTFLNIPEEEEFRDITARIKTLLAEINLKHQDKIFKISKGKINEFDNLADFINMMKISRYEGKEVPIEWHQLIGLLSKRRLVIHRSEPKLEKAIDLVRSEGKQKKCIVYSMDIASCEHIYSELQDEISAFRVHSGFKDREINKTLQEFKTASVGVLIAPRMLDEGIDIPDAEIGINVASSRTKLQFIQRIGRILRKMPNKKPVFHHFVAIPRDFIQSEDAFTYLNDLSWMMDLALRMGITPKSVEDIKELDTRHIESEEILKKYYNKYHTISLVGLGTFRLGTILEQIEPDIRRKLINIIESCSSPISDEEWFSLLRQAYGNEQMINLTKQWWILIIAGREPKLLQNLLLQSLK